MELTASALRTTFPAREDAPLAVTLWRLLSRGEPVTTSMLADATGRSPSQVSSQLERWPNVEHDSNRGVVAFGGLTLRDTAHRFEIDGRRGLHTWCAFDTLFLPAILEATAQVRSACPVTHRAVELVVTPERVENCDADALYVSFPPMAQADARNIARTFCCHVHFLDGADAARAWTAAHAHGAALRLPADFELGHDVIAPLTAVGKRR